MGLALLVVIWLITFFSTYFFAAKTWWLPHGVSTAAPWIDHQFALTYVLMGIVFVAAQGALGWLVWQYRDRRALPRSATPTAIPPWKRCGRRSRPSSLSA